MLLLLFLRGVVEIVFLSLILYIIYRAADNNIIHVLIFLLLRLVPLHLPKVEVHLKINDRTKTFFFSSSLRRDRRTTSSPPSYHHESLSVCLLFYLFFLSRSSFCSLEGCKRGSACRGLVVFFLRMDFSLSSLCFSSSSSLHSSRMYLYLYVCV